MYTLDWAYVCSSRDSKLRATKSGKKEEKKEEGKQEGVRTYDSAASTSRPNPNAYASSSHSAK